MCLTVVENYFRLHSEMKELTKNNSTYHVELERL